MTIDNDIAFTINIMPFNEDYQPSGNSRTTTNFANLARGKDRQVNLLNALRMINNRFNALASWDNPNGNRYSIKLEIVSVEVGISGNESTFPSIEILKTNIIDSETNECIEGIIGNNFSSYLRDYDFSILLPNYNQGKAQFDIPKNFGEIHGKLFKLFVNSSRYKELFTKPPVICLSVSDNKIYHRIENQHPVLGTEYLPNEPSLTEQYFQKMGLSVRYFMPQNSTAPLAFYFLGDLLNDYTNLEIISTISTMETFQKIYRPEIYNANTVAGQHYQPNLKNMDYSITHINYDRDERNRLAFEQGKFTQEHFIIPYRKLLNQWSTNNT